MEPEASTSWAPAGTASPGPTAAMRSPSISPSARLRVAGVPARICPPRMSMAMAASVLCALLLLGQQIVGVDLIDRALALELEGLGGGVAGLLELGGVELADRHLAAGDLARVHEARPDLRGADGAVAGHLGGGVGDGGDGVA